MRNSLSPSGLAPFKEKLFSTLWVAARLQAVRKSVPFKHLLLRTVAFTAFVSILFAFLPQLSKYEWKQDSGEYTWLWVSLGVGALACGDPLLQMQLK